MNEMRRNGDAMKQEAGITNLLVYYEKNKIS
jgi:hypothetical protein